MWLKQQSQENYTTYNWLLIQSRPQLRSTVTEQKYELSAGSDLKGY